MANFTRFRLYPGVDDESGEFIFRVLDDETGQLKRFRQPGDGFSMQEIENFRLQRERAWDGDKNTFGSAASFGTKPLPDDYYGYYSGRDYYLPDIVNNMVSGVADYFQGVEVFRTSAEFVGGTPLFAKYGWQKDYFDPALGWIIPVKISYAVGNEMNQESGIWGIIEGIVSNAPVLFATGAFSALAAPAIAGSIGLTATQTQAVLSTAVNTAVSGEINPTSLGIKLLTQGIGINPLEMITSALPSFSYDVPVTESFIDAPVDSVADYSGYVDFTGDVSSDLFNMADYAPVIDAPVIDAPVYDAPVYDSSTYQAPEIDSGAFEIPEWVQWPESFTPPDFTDAPPALLPGQSEISATVIDTPVDFTSGYASFDDAPEIGDTSGEGNYTPEIDSGAFEIPEWVNWPESFTPPDFTDAPPALLPGQYEVSATVIDTPVDFTSGYASFDDAPEIGDTYGEVNPYAPAIDDGEVNPYAPEIDSGAFEIPEWVNWPESFTPPDFTDAPPALLPGQYEVSATVIDTPVDFTSGYASFDDAPEIGDTYGEVNPIDGDNAMFDDFEYDFSDFIDPADFDFGDTFDTSDVFGGDAVDFGDAFPSVEDDWGAPPEFTDDELLAQEFGDAPDISDEEIISVEDDWGEQPEFTDDELLDQEFADNTETDISKLKPEQLARLAQLRQQTGTVATKNAPAKSYPDTLGGLANAIKDVYLQYSRKATPAQVAALARATGLPPGVVIGADGKLHSITKTAAGAGAGASASGGFLLAGALALLSLAH